MPLISRILYVVVSLLLPIGAHIADYSQSHIFNPKWPPHAKFHDGQTLMFSIFLGAITIYLAFRRTSDRTYAVIATTSMAAIYWITQGLAICYPGTAFFDPQFDVPSSYVMGLPAQLIVELVMLILNALAAYFALRKNARWTES